jgi:REP element-mobilizing transposase RayT
MTMARSRLVDLEVTRYYHCISRCVRRALLCGEGYEHRKQWIEDRIELLAGSFAVSVCGFSVMDNHLHVLVRLDSDRAKEWSEEEVVRLWMAVYPPRTLDMEDPNTVQAWVAHQMQDGARVAEYRQRLTELGWFMKALKEPLARMANQEDDCKGTFWESRYKSIAILDEEALLATCAYIDLNPVAAGIASTPETSRHTSVRQRVRHAKSQGKLSQLKAAAAGSVGGSRAAGRLEQDHWLCPLEERRGSAAEGGPREGGPREGMLEGFSLGSYLLLVDYTGRLCRQGKARMPRALAGIFQRLGTSAEFWGQRLKKLFAKSRLSGSYFTTDRARLRDLAKRRGVHHLDNLVPVTARSG